MSQELEFLAELLARERERKRQRAAKTKPQISEPSGYDDEPILMTGRQLMNSSSRRISQMRAIARKFGWHSYYYGGGSLFYEQAKFMESFTWEKPYKGSFFSYLPTYEDMTDSQLKGYFWWRTNWRRQTPVDGPLSFVQVYIYEVLCGIGVEPGEAGLAELKHLREYIRENYEGSFLPGELDTWMFDYALYYGLEEQLKTMSASSGSYMRKTGVLVRSEEALLKGATKWGDSASGLASQEEILDGLIRVSWNSISRSKLLKTHKTELAACTARVFAEMVAHCAKRRKFGFCEGIFGPPTIHPYQIFEGAVFYQEGAHPDVHYEINEYGGYLCRDGQWYEETPYSRFATDRKTGDMLHTIDRLLREKLGVKPGLKERKIPAYQLKIITQAIEDEFQAQAQRVQIDRSKLKGIRHAAAHTREALLVDEERDDEVAPAEQEVRAEVEKKPAAEMSTEIESEEGAAQVLVQNEVAPVTQNESSKTDVASEFGLSSQQVALLGQILGGTYDAHAWIKQGIMPSIEIDAINDALFDVVGDTVITFENDEPMLIEDYEQDVREALHL